MPPPPPGTLGDEAILDGLAEGFHGIAAELGEFVETGEARLGGEADSAGGRAPGGAVVGEAHLSRAGKTTVVPRLPPPMRPAAIQRSGQRKGRQAKAPDQCGKAIYICWPVITPYSDQKAGTT